jgi:quercetin dioxygenase-like cupin family protein
MSERILSNAQALQPVTAGSAGTHSKVYHFAAMPERKNANGSESFDVLRGELITGEPVSVHESVQPMGLAPNPAHVIQHTEVICVREGVLEFLHDGRTQRAAAGDVVFVAKGTRHQVRNVGDGPAAYFVVAVGGDAAGSTAPASKG